jgi:hypothetical protein
MIITCKNGVTGPTKRLFEMFLSFPGMLIRIICCLKTVKVFVSATQNLLVIETAVLVCLPVRKTRGKLEKLVPSRDTIGI